MADNPQDAEYIDSLGSYWDYEHHEPSDGYGNSDNHTPLHDPNGDDPATLLYGPCPFEWDDLVRTDTNNCHDIVPPHVESSTLRDEHDIRYSEREFGTHGDSPFTWDDLVRLDAERFRDLHRLFPSFLVEDQEMELDYLRTLHSPFPLPFFTPPASPVPSETKSTDTMFWSPCGSYSD